MLNVPIWYSAEHAQRLVDTKEVTPALQARQVAALLKRLPQLRV
jgi:hypothetical protein